MTAVKTLIAIALCWPLHLQAQLAITNEGFSVKFPTFDWSKQPAPAALRNTINKQGKLLIYTESPQGKFFVSRFDFPKGASDVAFVAGFIRGVRQSSGKSALREQFGKFQSTEFPCYTFSRDMQGNFLHSSAIFCSDHLYNIQIVGAESARADMLKILEAVSIRDKPMAMAIFNKAQEPGAEARATAFEAGRRVGIILGGLLGVAIVVLVIIGLFGGLAKRRPRPPPLPRDPNP